MQTRRREWVVRNKHLGDHHQNNNGWNNVDKETALVHYSTTGFNLRTQMQALKDMQAATHTNKSWILNIRTKLLQRSVVQYENWNKRQQQNKKKERK